MGDEAGGGVEEAVEEDVEAVAVAVACAGRRRRGGLRGAPGVRAGVGGRGRGGAGREGAVAEAPAAAAGGAPPEARRVPIVALLA